MREYKGYSIKQIGTRFRVHLKDADVFNSLSLSDCKAFIDIETFQEMAINPTVLKVLEEDVFEPEEEPEPVVEKIPKVVYNPAAFINVPEVQELYEKSAEFEKSKIKPPAPKKEPYKRKSKEYKALTVEEIAQREKIRAMLRTKHK